MVSDRLCHVVQLLVMVMLVLTVLRGTTARLPATADIQVDAGRTVSRLPHFWTSTGFW